MERHIFLVGMPGSGKSALGRRVAQKLQIPYLDTDFYLAEASGLNTALDIRAEKRPFLAQKGRDEIERIYHERMPIYRSVADTVMDNGNGFHNGLAALEEIVRRYA